MIPGVNIIGRKASEASANGAGGLGREKKRSPLIKNFEP